MPAGRESAARSACAFRMQEPVIDPRVVAADRRLYTMGAFPDVIRIAGVDLAWGERRPDGVCVLEANRQRARVRTLGLPQGDDELLALLDEQLEGAPAFIAMDAPIVCRNLTGARPDDPDDTGSGNVGPRA